MKYMTIHVLNSASLEKLVIYDSSCAHETDSFKKDTDICTGCSAKGENGCVMHYLPVHWDVQHCA
jgi:hypothetical protein